MESLQENSTESAPFATNSSMGLQKALVFYAMFAPVVVGVLFFSLKLRLFGAIVVALIAGQVFLNAILFPSSVNFLTDFDSYVALYTMIQIATPVAVIIYTVTHAFSDRRF